MHTLASISSSEWAMFLLVAYFAPVIVSISRKHPQKIAISVLDVLAGWTVVGWIVAMVWACTNTGAVKRAD
jgi:cell division protein FtsX